MAPKLRWFLAVVLAAIVLDQATKLWVVANIAYRTDEIVVIPGLFSLVHAQNPGAALGLLRDFEYRHVVFLGFTLVAIGIIVDALRRLAADDRGGAVVLGLILGGALGNAIDRVHKRTVTDFLRVYVDAEPVRGWLERNLGTNEWPAFNVADSVLVVGVCLYVLQSLRARPSEPTPEAEPR